MRFLSEHYSNAALVLFGHGSTADAEAGAPVYAHAAELRRRGCFAEVREAFWKQEPRLTQVLEEMKTPTIFLAPLFISEGYFVETVIPEALGFAQAGGVRSRVRQRGGQTLCYCKPVGTSGSMTGILLDRAREVTAKFPFPRPPAPADTTLFIAGHGTKQNENSRKAIEQQAGLVRARSVFAAVEAVFLEEEPRIEECLRLARTRNVVVVPFFVSDGPHTRKDIPQLLGEPARLVEQRLQNRQPAWRNPTERDGRLVWYAASVGTHPGVADIVLERVSEMSGRDRQ
jgi:sirohydrochlorin cobaltochelatase